MCNHTPLPADPYSPFNEDSGSRVNTRLTRTLSLGSGDEEFKVQASYRGEGEYTLALDGEDCTPASGNIRWEGLGAEGARSLKLRGSIGDHQVSADVATVNDTIHIFTRVS